MKKPVRRRGRNALSETPVVLFAFSVDDVTRITGISKARLTRWDKLKFFSPEFADEDDRGNPYSRVYSFNDLVGLRTLAILTDKFRVALSELRAAHNILAHSGGVRPWSKIRLAVANRKIVTHDDQGRPCKVVDGQYSFIEIDLPEIARDISSKADALRKRDSSKVGVIERYKFVARNAPVLAGTRIPVRAIDSFIDEGYSDDGIVAEYPTQTAFDVATVRRQMRVAA